MFRMVALVVLMMGGDCPGIGHQEASPRPNPEGPDGQGEARDYEVLAEQDWRVYQSKDDLKGLFGVEGRLNDCYFVREKTRCDPHLPASAFFDLVPDSLFGQVVRYNGDPTLNTRVRDMPGRVAIHGVRFAGLTNVWVRQFIRFSPNYTTIGRRGGQGASSHKMMFLRYEESSLRQSWVIEGPRGMTLETGAQNELVARRGTLPWNNVRIMNQRYNVTGWPFPDGWPMFASAVGPRGAPTGPGNGEWYEIVLHHKASGARGEHTLAWRRYTRDGKVDPTPWSFRAMWHEYRPGQTWKKIVKYEMGVNRNRQWDETMYVYWGPYEVVDGSRFPNPWDLPGA